MGFGTTVELELSEDEVLLVIASFEAAADAATETDDAMEVFLTSEVLIGPALVVLEVSDEDLIGAVAGLLDVDDNVDEVFVEVVVEMVEGFLVLEPLVFTGLFLLVSSVLLLTLVSSTGVSSTSLMASLIVSVLDF